MVGYVLGWVACVFVCIFILIPFGIDSGVAAILSLVLGTALFLGVILAYGKYKANEYKRIKEATKDNMKYDLHSKTLTLMERRNSNGMALKIMQMTDQNLKYHEAQYVYTGATVGGITTGGIHKTGDYHTIESTSTGKYEICYKDRDIYHNDQLYPIKSIKLTNEMVEKAKKDELLHGFLKDDTLVLEKETNNNGDLMKSALNANNTTLAMQIAKKDYFDKQLTKEECTQIVNWIVGIR